MERAECPAVEVPEYVLQIPAPDYPQHWGLVGDNVDHEEKDYLFKSYPEEDLPPLRGNAPWRVGAGFEHALPQEEKLGFIK